LHEEFGYDSFVFVHDLLTVDREYISDLSDAMHQSRLRVQWMANSRTDISLHGLLPKMKLSGCWKLFLGIESASSRIQTSICKGLVSEEILASVHELLDNGISATCSFVIGFADESTAELSSTIDLASRLKLLGVETIQFHRLRLWPPAPLSLKDLQTTFDEDSLRIEYPFTEVSSEDIEAIRCDPVFFEGYFAPESQAGERAQLAQVEMLFQHAVGLIPLTISALSNILKDHLITSFYETLKRAQPVRRQDLDWESGDLYRNWLAIKPLISSWTSVLVSPTKWQHGFLKSLLEYEERRLRFVSGIPAVGDILGGGENWIAFATAVNLNEVMRRLNGRLTLTPEVMKDNIVVLVEREFHKFHGFLLEPQLSDRLLTRCQQLWSFLGIPKPAAVLPRS
jgi:hypothetical protein